MGQWAGRGRGNKTERATGVGRRARKEIVKWNQTTALRFKTGGRHQTSLASLRGPLLWADRQIDRQIDRWSPEGGRGCLMSPPCPQSQGCRLIPLLCIHFVNDTTANVYHCLLLVSLMAKTLAGENLNQTVGWHADYLFFMIEIFFKPSPKVD